MEFLSSIIQLFAFNPIDRKGKAFFNCFKVIITTK